MRNSDQIFIAEHIHVGVNQALNVTLFLSSQEEDMPEEVNIDEILDLQSDEERIEKLKVSAL